MYKCFIVSELILNRNKAGSCGRIPHCVCPFHLLCQNGSVFEKGSHFYTGHIFSRLIAGDVWKLGVFICRMWSAKFLVIDRLVLPECYWQRLALGTVISNVRTQRIIQNFQWSDLFLYVQFSTISYWFCDETEGFQAQPFFTPGTPYTYLISFLRMGW
jgi:hypothetical protein